MQPTCSASSLNLSIYLYLLYILMRASLSRYVQLFRRNFYACWCFLRRKIANNCFLSTPLLNENRAFPMFYDMQLILSLFGHCLTIWNGKGAVISELLSSENFFVWILHPTSNSHCAYDNCTHELLGVFFSVNFVFNFMSANRSVFT